MHIYFLSSLCLSVTLSMSWRKYKVSLSEKNVNYTKASNILYVANDKAVTQVYQREMPFGISE